MSRLIITHLVPPQQKHIPRPTDLAIILKFLPYKSINQQNNIRENSPLLHNDIALIIFLWVPLISLELEQVVDGRIFEVEQLNVEEPFLGDFEFGLRRVF